MLNQSLVARQLWYWVPQWRYDLETLMKCVCKVLIYHSHETQHFIMIWHGCSRPWKLWGSAPNKSENMNTQEWLIWPPFFVGVLVITHFIYAYWRILVIESFKCLSSFKRFLASNASSLKIDLYLGFAHRQRISAGHQMFYGIWICNHPFYWFSLKDLYALPF